MEEERKPSKPRARRRWWFAAGAGAVAVLLAEAAAKSRSGLPLTLSILDALVLVALAVVLVVEAAVARIDLAVHLQAGIERVRMSRRRLLWTRLDGRPPVLVGCRGRSSSLRGAALFLAGMRRPVSSDSVLVHLGSLFRRASRSSQYTSPAPPFSP